MNQFVEISHSCCSARESCVTMTSNGERIPGHGKLLPSPFQTNERRMVYIYCQQNRIMELRVDTSVQDLWSGR